MKKAESSHEEHGVNPLAGVGSLTDKKLCDFRSQVLQHPVVNLHLVQRSVAL